MYMLHIDQSLCMGESDIKERSIQRISLPVNPNDRYDYMPRPSTIRDELRQLCGAFQQECKYLILLGYIYSHVQAFVKFKTHLNKKRIIVTSVLPMIVIKFH